MLVVACLLCPLVQMCGLPLRPPIGPSRPQGADQSVDVWLVKGRAGRAAEERRREMSNIALSSPTWLYRVLGCCGELCMQRVPDGACSPAALTPQGRCLACSYVAPAPISVHPTGREARPSTAEHQRAQPPALDYCRLHQHGRCKGGQKSLLAELMQRTERRVTGKMHLSGQAPELTLLLPPVPSRLWISNAWTHMRKRLISRARAAAIGTLDCSRDICLLLA